MQSSPATATSTKLLPADHIHDQNCQAAILTHLNADTSWLLQLPYPTNSRTSSEGVIVHYYNILIDPWLAGSQSDIFPWFSQQWHAQDSRLQNVSAVEDLVRKRESQLSAEQKVQSTANGVTQRISLIDAVVISHEFTDHCHKETLLQLDPSVPVFATKRAANLIRSWTYFHNILEIPVFAGKVPGAAPDWKDTSIDPLPDWIGIGRVASQEGSRVNLHSAILFSFGDASGVRHDESHDTDHHVIRGVVYTPHGSYPEDLRIVSQANPRIQVLALLHGLHDVSIGSWRQGQVNLGAHNGLKAWKALGAKYWIATHDEVNRMGGLLSYLLIRKPLTVKDALNGEVKEQDNVAKGDGQVDCTDVTFVEVANGESAFL